MKQYFFLLIVCQTGLLSAQNIIGVYKGYEGTIGKDLALTADLLIADTLMTGHYYYPSKGEEINLKGTLKNQSFILTATSAAKIIGYFSGKMSNNFSLMEGTWSSVDSSKSIPFTMHSFLREGRAEIYSLYNMFSFEWRKNTLGEPLGCSASYTYCYLVNAKDKTVQKKINEVLLNDDLKGDENPGQLMKIAQYAMEDDFDNSIDTYRETFPDSIAAENKPYMDKSPFIYNWNYQDIYSVMFNDHYLLSIKEFEYSFRGGAHGNFGLNYQLFSLKTGGLLLLDDLFNPEKRKELTAIAEKQLRIDRNIDNAASLLKSGLLIEKLELKEDFYIDRGGIGFTYNPYEIASYADGAITIYLKWEQVKALIKPVGPLSWVLIR